MGTRRLHNEGLKHAKDIIEALTGWLSAKGKPFADLIFSRSRSLHLPSYYKSMENFLRVSSYTGAARLQTLEVLGIIMDAIPEFPPELAAVLRAQRGFLLHSRKRSFEDADILELQLSADAYLRSLKALPGGTVTIKGRAVSPIPAFPKVSLPLPGHLLKHVGEAVDAGGPAILRNTYCVERSPPL